MANLVLGPAISRRFIGERTPVAAGRSPFECSTAKGAIVVSATKKSANISPTVSYDRRQRGRNQLNIPIGLGIAKTMMVRNVPTKFQFGFEYSVVSQDDFGQRFQVKLNVIPVIKSLVKSPLLGGGG